MVQLDRNANGHWPMATELIRCMHGDEPDKHVYFTMRELNMILKNNRI